MFSKNIKFKIYYLKKKNLKVRKIFISLIKKYDETLKSLSSNYKDAFNKESIKKLQKFKDIRIIGMGGASLGAKAIYDFLSFRIKKKFDFHDNLKVNNHKNLDKKKLNVIISKSGETIETIVNANILINKKDKNFFIIGKKNSHLYKLANKLKSEILIHNDFIGGRYSVLSEVGMLPAQLMGLNYKKFRQLNELIKNKNFLNSLISNVSFCLSLIKDKKFNSVIVNYDQDSQSLFYWYQQLVAESLGKNNKGLLPIISTMPKDNHSLMQLYLDGPQNNFYTFFYSHNDMSDKINNSGLSVPKSFFRNKCTNDIMFAQMNATKKIFIKKKIPFRSFEIKTKDEKTLGEIFCFFILETILLGRALKIDPYNQPAVEQIKKETKKILLK